ncbi:MAG: transglutaminase [Clostridia bacterium]|nr:transglutaminase [Clostridia bacterium]
MEKYLRETFMLNYNSQEIVGLIRKREWNNLDEYGKIGAIYDYVQNEIALGYNKYDTLSATQVIKDGYGQCNTKATLIMALLRAVGVPCRLHGSKVTKAFQRSLMTKLMANLAPSSIVHTWAEVYYNGEWLSLEGAITDKAYIDGLRKLFPDYKGKFFDYAVAVQDFDNLQIDWNGKPTAIQQQAVMEDLGIFDSPDDFYSEYQQEFHGIKKFLYENIGRKIMTARVAKIRRGKHK